ncbi:chemotaxis protein [Vibrio sp. UCD-FRSSP16_10]|uniref:DUF3379 family protein n=1 Tax=unclassified Vibrio TaxID=2614977 RepID=UPI000801637C|nr:MULTISPECIES: DUF3379 family protein [unclassified Vibrio]OBT15868.1 chemotaxis protein [Vibrio sp. UCD-FRSSP16_10]OBT17762.1 chemotaxis protein [Vibrio sp. UCD-FRSSP16_30]
MDDLEFRRRIMSDPKARDEDIIDAITSNEHNTKFVDDVLNLDARIEQAMRVDVPDDLADKILFNQSNDDNVVRARFSKAFAKKSFAIAASVAFAAGVLVGQLNWSANLIPAAHASLADTAVQHVIDESPFTNQLDEQVNSTQINAKLTPFSYQFSESFPYHVYYLNHCGFGEANALHMVFEGEKGRITLFITNISSEHTLNFNEQQMSGAIVPIGNASMILVGESDEDVSEVAKQLSSIIIPMS